MSSSCSDVNEIKKELTAHCSINNTAFINGILNESRGNPSVLLNIHDFMTVLKSENIKTVFFTDCGFSIDECLKSELKEIGWVNNNERAIITEQVKDSLASYLKKINDYAGDLYFFMAFFVTNGLIVKLSYQADWYLDFIDKLEVIFECKIEEHEQESLRKDELSKVSLNLLVDEIANREDFKKANGLPKKAMIIRKFYEGKIPEDPNGRIVKLKQHLEPMDNNFAYVLKNADEKAWLIKSEESKC
ncbi:hypothetical protein V6917_06515 [Pectobacterium brasiliense]|uniref:hypothetical protein n=1 Tax=Pectobacterium brasiliense TaxID=180957 RepID=UPI0030CAEAD9